MKYLKVNSLSPKDKQEILELWNNEYPRNLRYESLEQLENYLKELKDQSHILIVNDNDRIIGWYFDFIREGERWFAAILNSDFQGKKFGTKLMELAKENRNELNGWVIPSSDYMKLNATPYRSPLGFYVKNGFQVHPDIKLETDKISAIKISWSAHG